MQTTKLPYELLARWGEDGQFRGAHIQHRFVILDDTGAKVAESLGPAKELKRDTAGEFSLDDLLNQAQADALTAHGTVLAERDAALAALDAATQQLAQAAADRDAALARVAALEAVIATADPSA